MPKRLVKIINHIQNEDEEYSHNYIIPEVDFVVIEPKIKIWDSSGFYWFRRIGFNRKITDDD